LAASGEADFVEFKCFTQPNSDREKWVAENVKLRKAWVQSFLVGVPRIVVGWRNASTGVVERMEEIRTVDIPGREGVEWSAQETLSIVVRVLENLLQLTAEGQFYMVTWHAADKSMTVKQQPVSTTVLFSFTKLFK
jgi:RAT1-interacting protein